MSHPPNIKYYDADSMMTDPTRASNRKSFLEWYNTHKNDTFNFNKELLRYCRSDVDILRCCCLKFRDLFFEIKYERNGGTDHFAHFITIALACNLVFRKKFLNPETIGIIRIHGYRPYEKHSMKALKWIQYMASTKRIQIQHARNGGEKRLGEYLVDGYHESESGSKTVFKYHGCFGTVAANVFL